jgi:uncharacterized protein (TIGR02147 family)
VKNRFRPHEILNSFFARKKEQNPAYSLRALARDLTVSPAFMSQLLAGNKKVPLKKLARLTELLDFDRPSVQALRRAIVAESHGGEEIFRDSTEKKSRSDLLEFSPLPKKKGSLFSKWYYVAVLDLMDCEDFQSDPQWIARRLGLFQNEAIEAIATLTALDLVAVRAGKLRKKKNKIRFTTTQTLAEIRSYHRQMIQKALHELEFKTTAEDFTQRMITGGTLSIHRRDIERAQIRLSEFLHEFVAEFATDQADEVYQINLQYFPLSKKSKC